MPTSRRNIKQDKQISQNLGGVYSIIRSENTEQGNAKITGKDTASDITDPAA
jgi:hypothetical protein